MITGLIVGALLLLPPKAEAVQVRVTGPDAFRLPADRTFTLEYTFDTNELVPVDRLEAIL